MANTNGGDNSFWLGFVCGVLVGSVTAGLLAPRRGQETREVVRETGLELKDRAEDVVVRAQTVAADTLLRVQDRAKELLNRPASES